jgi:hypothetical protein
LIPAEVLRRIEIELDLLSLCDLVEWILSVSVYPNQNIARPDACTSCRTAFFDAIGDDLEAITIDGVGAVSPNDAVGEDRTLDNAVPQIERSRNNCKHCYKKQ